MTLKTALRAALVLAVLATMQPAHAKDTAFMTLRTQYVAASEQRGDAVQRALGTVEALLKADPADAVAMAYKGSLLTMAGGDAMMPWNKLKYVNVGLELMDDAIARSGGARAHDVDAQVEILMVSAFTFSRLPAMFKREPQARKTITSLIAHPAFDTLEPKLRAQALAIAAAYAAKDGKATEAQALLDRASTADALTARQVYNARS